ncbi:hypothetical protein B9T36_11625 [Acinetobacter sp. ANC 4204]|uniref:hypothetical protein n=1 Tax=Acinetobacter sp. ANC 4204 TaxID=1977884 RepID=UPI000A337168|nr:hypothetical protein [Acinetobacter sp. ANC 4204]OTG58116.1 hypothetical protein B9T36_11625 [Acinetobacter sp. ANC 4204]
MNLLSKIIVIIASLLSVSSLMFGIYIQDLLILSVGLLFALFSIVFSLETQHILNNPFRK